MLQNKYINQTIRFNTSYTHIKNYIFFLFSTLIYICKKVIISNENKLDTSKNKSQGFNKIVLLLQRENGWDNEINK